MQKLPTEGSGSRAHDSDLIERAQSGDYDAIKKLVVKYEPWVFNIALRMTGQRQDAEDATQEILMKMLTKLSTFGHKSDFSTWLYRIAANHVLNMKLSQREKFFLSFESHKEFIGETGVMDSRGGDAVDPDEGMMVYAVKTQCMMGMLLCLDRRQRLVFILGFIFGLSSKVGGEVLEISQEGFRQELHRARKQLRNYMDENCGLINEGNSCSCERKTKAAIGAGYVDSATGLFDERHVAKVRDVVISRSRMIEGKPMRKIREQFLQSPFIESSDFSAKLTRLL